ncbi:MAG: type II toxin-antitoxin system VapC family toxin [Trebonia sp.]
MDSSALVKRYVAEPDSELVRAAMQADDGWFACRIAFVETVRAVGLAAGEGATQPLREEWPSFGVVEVDQELVEHAAQLALDDGLRSLDALHLAAALLLATDELVLATWDRRLHAAAQSHQLSTLPERLP